MNKNPDFEKRGEVARIQRSKTFEIVQNGPHEENWNIRKRMQLWREAKSLRYKVRSEARALIMVQQILTFN